MSFTHAVETEVQAAQLFGVLSKKFARQVRKRMWNNGLRRLAAVKADRSK